MSKFLKEKFRDPETKSLIGPCMITFAIPLFIPGFTLTLVAFEDETGFSKYSALHVTGMLFLASASIILIVGIIMKCACKSKVSPIDDMSHQMVSTHAKHSSRKVSDMFSVEHGRKSSVHMEREPVPGASVGSNDVHNENLTIANEIMSIPDETDTKPTYSGRILERENTGSSRKDSLLQKEAGVSSHREHKTVNWRSESTEADGALGTGLRESGDSKDDGGQPSNTKSKAVIRETFSNMRSEGDGAENAGVSSDNGASSMQRNQADSGTRTDEEVQKRTSVAWDDPSDVK